MNTRTLTVTIAIAALAHLEAAPLGTAFTYQGRLTDGGQAANGVYDLRSAIYDVPSGGSPLAGPITNSPVGVTDGLFTVTLDFGANVFSGEARWLEIAVRTNGGDQFAVLGARQALTASPYALYSPQAGAAAHALGVVAGGVDNASLAPGAITADKIAAGQVVKSLNNLTDAVTLNPGANVRVSKVGNTIEVGAASDGMLRLEGPEAQGVGGRILFGWAPTANTYISEAIDNGIFLVAPAGVGIGPGNLGVHLNSLTDATHTLTVGGDILARPASGFGPGTTATVFLGDENNYIKGVWGEGVRLGVWNGMDSLSLKNGGHLGVGTTNPEQRLDVALGDAIVRGPDSFAGPGSTATLYLGDTVHYFRATREYGLTLGTWPIGEALTIREPNGYVGIGTNTPQTTLHVVGTTRTSVLEITGGSDLAEPFVVSDATPVPEGAVVVIDERNPGRLRLSTEAYDKRVAGVVSGAGSLKPGLMLSQAGVTDEGVPVALSGRVFVLADAAGGAIQPGDQLTTSATPGHARKVMDYELARGAVLGKAMSSLETGRGLVLVLVTLQ